MRTPSVECRARASQCGFTLIELLVVIAIISVLGAIIFPVFARARTKARQAGCNSNLRQIGIAFGMYRTDHDDLNTFGSYPRTELMDADYYWAPFDDTANPLNGPPGQRGVTYMEGTLFPYAKNLSLFRCPTVPTYQLGFGMNNRPEGPSGAEDAIVEDPAGTLLAFDHESITPPLCGILDPTHHQDSSRHNEGMNILWYDGHVKWMRGSLVTAGMFSVADD